MTVAEYTGLPRDAVLFYREFDEGTENVEEYARLVQAKALSRNLINLAQRLGAQAMESDPLSVLDGLEREVMRLRPQRGQGFEKISTLGAVTLGEKPSIIPSGFPTIDVYTDGLGAGRLIILAARPSIGKTTLALNMAANVARAGGKVAVFSLEMLATSVIEKLLLAEADIDHQRVKNHWLTEDDIGRIGEALVRMNTWNLHLDDTSTVTLSELGARVKRLRVEHGLDLLVVDYLGLLTPPKAENRVNEIAAITRYLKALSMELGIPVLALSQLNRLVEQSGDGEPNLANLRDSGTVEQDADQVIFLWRDPKDPRNPPGAEIRFTHGKVGKNRGGPEGPFDLALIGAKSKFVGV